MEAYLNVLINHFSHTDLIKLQLFVYRELCKYIIIRNVLLVYVLMIIKHLSNLLSGTGWRALTSPTDHPVSQYEFDILIGADGRRNTLEGMPSIISVNTNFFNVLQLLLRITFILNLYCQLFDYYGVCILHLTSI